MTSMLGHFTATFGSFILILCTTLAYSATENLVTPKTDSVYKLANLSVSVPIMVHTVIQNFIKGNSVNVGKTRTPNFASLRRVLLYGPFGVGKTQIAKKIAEVTNSELIELSGSGIINSFQGSGATTIKNTFAIIAQKLKKSDARIVLFIDEVDAITSNNIPDNYKDMKNAQLELWQEIERFKLERRLLIIFATNNLSTIPGGTLSRMYTKIEVLAPTMEQRKELLQTEFSQFNRPCLSEYMLANIIEELASINPALMSELKQSGAQLSQTLVDLARSLENYNVLRKNDEQLQSLQLLIAKVTRDSTAFLEHAKKECAHNSKEASEKTMVLVQQYFNSVMQYLVDTKDYLTAEQPSFTPDQLKLLAEQTEGMSNRLLVGLVENIAEKYYNHNKKLTDDIIIKELERAKKNLDLELKDAQRAQQADADKEEETKERSIEREHRAKLRTDYVQEKKSRKRDELLRKKEFVERKKGLIENDYSVDVFPYSTGFFPSNAEKDLYNKKQEEHKARVKRVDDEIDAINKEIKTFE